MRGGRMAQTNDAEKQLAGFMAKFTDEVSSLAEAILGEMRRLYPTALAIGFSPTERASDGIFSIALFPRWVSLFFLQAQGLPDPDRILKGGGNVVKHIVLPSPATLHEPAVSTLMHEATVRAKVPLDLRGAHRLIIKSISAKQRPRRPAQEKAAKNAPAKSKAKGTKRAGARSR